jgi:tripartite-type tricarboxylate transporter receptor subunit TctC
MLGNERRLVALYKSLEPSEMRLVEWLRIIIKLNAAVVAALTDPAVRSRLGDLGMEIFPSERQTPEALAARVKADAEKWWPVMKEFGIKAD